MGAIATTIGMPPDLWSLVGFIHDADYVEAPHHVEEVGLDTAHPFTLLDELAGLGAPASVQLAVLEHAAHTELAPSTQLSAALILVDEHSTMTAYGYQPHYGPYASTPVVAALSPAPSSVSGYHRPDMAERALAALRVLVAV